MGRSLQSVALNLEPSQYLGGWRAEGGTLFLPALSDSRVGEEAAVRIGIYGQSIRATVFGKVAMVRRVGRPSLPPGVELTLDKASLPAARFLAMAARGEPVTFRERAPRFAVERPLAIRFGEVEVSATTINVSEGGCSVQWQGSLPQVGEVVGIRMRDGIFAPTARAVVCWNTVGGPLARSVGLRIISEGRAGRSWRNLVAEVSRSGARSA
jgi:hypothetical protein